MTSALLPVTSCTHRISSLTLVSRAVPMLKPRSSMDCAAGSAASKAQAGPDGEQLYAKYCASCHNQAHPLQDDAQAVLEGLPAVWEPGQTYPLTIRIEGGPDPLPAPQPQGGFEIATVNATLRIAPGNGNRKVRY